MKDGPIRAGRLTAKLAQSTQAIQDVLQRALPSIAEAVPQLQRSLPSFRVPGLRGTSAPALSLPSGAAFLTGSYTGSTGTRPYRFYVPSHPAAPAPLLVMLHGCTQTPEDFAAGTRMNSLAEAAGALVLYPAQVASANQQRCWNWFNPSDQAAIMASTYPELFAAVGVHSGLACGAASDMVSAFAAMRQGKAGRGPLGVPCIVFHGDADHTVNLRNAAMVASQAGAAGGADITRGQVPGGLAYTRTRQRSAEGRAIEQWIVHGAGHAWSGGSPEGSYTEPRGPDASREMLRFFMEAAR